MKDKDTPLRLVRLWPKMIPGCYETLDELAAEYSQKVPDYCPLPIAAAFSCIYREGYTEQESANGCAELLACWAWRKNKIIYRFDSDLARMLAEQAAGAEPEDVLPVDLLLHLPYPIFYVKTDIYDFFDGFFFWLEYDWNRKETEIRVSWLLNETMENTIPYVLHLFPGKTLRECCEATDNETAKYLDELTVVPGAKERMDKYLPVMQAIQLVLYLCAANADITPDPRPVAHSPRHPQMPKPPEDKASEIESYSIGVHIGAAIRMASAGAPSKNIGSGGAGSAKRPHSRRGHWHHYWTGPRDGAQTLILKWVAPTFIHAEDVSGEAAEIVVFPVKENNERK